MAKRRDWSDIMQKFMDSSRQTRRIKMTNPKVAQVQAWRLARLRRRHGLFVRTSGATIIIEKV